MLIILFVNLIIFNILPSCLPRTHHKYTSTRSFLAIFFVGCFTVDIRHMKCSTTTKLIENDVEIVHSYMNIIQILQRFRKLSTYASSGIFLLSFTSVYGFIFDSPSSSEAKNCFYFRVPCGYLSQFTQSTEHRALFLRDMLIPPSHSYAFN